MKASLNVLGTPLKPCSQSPMTGWYRDGCCNTDADDHGSHTVCARVSAAFLAALREAGNDLVTPMPQFRFPGLQPGDQWCVCAGSWRWAAENGFGCPVDLEATHAAALEVVPLELLMAHAVSANEA